MRVAAARCVAVDHRRGIRPTPWSVITRHRPEVALLRLPPPGVQHRHHRLVGEHLRRSQHDLLQPRDHRRDLRRRIANPESECGTIDLHALPRHHLRLAIQRQMVGVAGDQHMRHHRLSRQAALDQARRRRLLHHHTGAAATGELRPPRHDHPELRPGSRRAVRICLRRSPPLRPGSRGSWSAPAPAQPRCGADAQAAGRDWSAARVACSRRSAGSRCSASASTLAIALRCPRGRIAADPRAAVPTSARIASAAAAPADGQPLVLRIKASRSVVSASRSAIVANSRACNAATSVGSSGSVVGWRLHRLPILRGCGGNGNPLCCLHARPVEPVEQRGEFHS